MSLKDTNPCTSSPCQNQGICAPLNEETFECECPAGFSGDTCSNLVTTTTTITTMSTTRANSLSTSQEAATIMFPTIPSESIAVLPDTNSTACRTVCYNQGVCNNSQCICQPGTDGLFCERIFGCRIPMTDNVLPINRNRISKLD